MKTGIAALALLATLSLGACAKQSDAGNGAGTEATANSDASLGDANLATDNTVDLGGNAADLADGNASNAL